MGNTPRQESLVLSRGAVLDKTFDKVYDDYPTDGTTRIDFYDSAGNVIATVNGTVSAKQLVYLITDTDTLDAVPSGATYECFYLTIDGHPYKRSYGTVIRREASFYTPPATSLQAESRLFTDLLSRDAVGRRWVTTQGRVTMHNLGGTPPVYGMGPDIGLLFSQAGVRYFRPMGGDSWRFKFKIHFTNSGIGPGGNGKLALYAGCDQHMHSGMSFQIEVDSSTPGTVYTGLVTSPVANTNTGSVADTVHNLDTWTVDYSDLTKTMNVYKGDDPSVPPTISWEDVDNVLPHGPGYRYWGFSWDSSLVATGPELLSVEAQDYV